MPRIINICGARPNFMKIAPLMRAYRGHPNIVPLIVHTGQHYDANMSEVFFRQLGIPEPDLNLEVGSGSHAQQTAQIMSRFEPVVQQHRPDWVLVVGDVNSTIACALVATKLGVRVAHVEAGLRSFDRGMPEEINRLLTDAISDLLLVSEPSGLENLRREGVAAERVHFVGNVMIDTLRFSLEHARRTRVLDALGLAPRGYNVLTLHRPSNVDDPLVFGRLLDALERISADLQVVFPIHPRTRANLARLGLQPRLDALRGLRLVEPLGYLEFLRLMADAAVVLTDSGGIQEETTILGVWCLTLRENTERPVTLTSGTNTLVGTDPQRIVAAYERCRKTPLGEPRVPEKWDGRAAERIAELLAKM
ncbi:MAG: UDP-N-acetylglucosamine 2-epimerase (non-hydrolyzing) [Phycisphaerae bacterium]|nr:UDP-N-acetylglucosamine 2-epimerase (non-hydrolyzing) [Phycisphaerae bacterium]MCZ2399631.1 UDP-N-acetylglucosamine 2-epimerase (non-hydrolyzing) [Phycisphaerae bacterium]NUQ50710.1 UDP-N-acetylglucosamine 2-epimerase (non-hydrolyzing) [Phycisphaerae bacterium]